jgi:hypothetical protein
MAAKKKVAAKAAKSPKNAILASARKAVKKAKKVVAKKKGPAGAQKAKRRPVDLAQKAITQARLAAKFSRVVANLEKRAVKAAQTALVRHAHKYSAKVVAKLEAIAGVGEPVVLKKKQCRYSPKQEAELAVIGEAAESGWAEKALEKADDLSVLYAAYAQRPAAQQVTERVEDVIDSDVRVSPDPEAVREVHEESSEADALEVVRQVLKGTF